MFALCTLYLILSLVSILLVWKVSSNFHVKPCLSTRSDYFLDVLSSVHEFLNSNPFQCPVNDLTDAAKAYFSFWIELSTTPYGSPLDTTKMFWPVALPRKSHFKAAAKMRAVKPEGDPYKNICFGSAEGTSLQEKNGDTSTHIGKIIVGGDVDISVTQTRVVTATALGVLASKLDDSSLQYVVDPLWNALASFSGVQRQV